MTEESVETLAHLGMLDRVIGVSGYVKRPEEARQLPVISAFTHANLKKILSLKPDLVLGFSDIQKDIARDLVGAGVEVYIANHRRLEGILAYVLKLSGLVGEEEKGRKLALRLYARIQEARKEASRFSKAPRVYFEEWPNPQISAIGWVSELIEICGGKDVFTHKSRGSLATERIVSHEEIVAAGVEIFLGCWCGKALELKNIQERFTIRDLPALESGRIVELEPEIFLQPGPAPILDGIPQLLRLFGDFQ